MSQMRIATLESLLERLEAVLGPDSLLLRRFALGLQREDERRLSDAMQSLRLYPPEVRHAVEDTVMSWLFGERVGPEEERRGATPGP